MNSSHLNNITLYVRWFSVLKGYGFAISPEIDGDVFFHFSLIQNLGITNIDINDEICCDLITTEKGYQINRIISFSKGKTSVGRPTHKDEKIIIATIKWFNAAKGYGFAQCIDSSRDIFIHDSLLRRKQIANLIPGSMIKLAVIDSKKGLECVDIIDYQH